MMRLRRNTRPAVADKFNLSLKKTPFVGVWVCNQTNIVLLWYVSIGKVLLTSQMIISQDTLYQDKMVCFLI
jgi:hypothetical protein